MATASKKTALVTGAASGIGRAITESLVKTGYHVIAFDRAGKDLRRVAKAFGSSVTPVLVDLRKSTSIAKAFERLRAKRVKLDLVVNNAGVAQPDRLDLKDIRGWDALLEVNLLAVWIVSRQAFPFLRRGSMLINIASSGARFPMKFQASYSATKAGVAAFSQALREEWREHGIRISTIFPGPTKSGILRSFPPTFLKAHRVMEEPRLEAKDIADAVLFALAQPQRATCDEIMVTPARWSMGN